MGHSEMQMWCSNDKVENWTLLRVSISMYKYGKYVIMKLKQSNIFVYDFLSSQILKKICVIIMFPHI